ncbi:hypothetical protein D8Y22_06070 [Salinadaptatus halalkaliphilus]|uniref:Uncharacterized protein n=1 Tax=Salinadaptatus halalkaliphilus TaxID=2419781 RepID=A0A4S3TQZ2_9EURY|nr:hypothetical protein [Salinadaptatus halalkaliphilus]THE65733.1 hypothetical protein D8Y22_06070 [Salinadaptatus halalkaliphilus]
MYRRQVLLGTGAVVSLAGCLSDDSEIDEMERGRIEIVIDDEPVDLEADRFQSEHAEEYSIDFHFHEFDEFWYMEGEKRVTFAEAIDLIPHFEYATDEGEHVLTYDGTTYDTNHSEIHISFFHNDDPVDPTEQLLYNGDELLVEVETDGME